MPRNSKRSENKIIVGAREAIEHAQSVLAARQRVGAPTAKQPKRSRKPARTKATKPKRSEATLAVIAWLRAWAEFHVELSQRYRARKADISAFDNTIRAQTLNWLIACVERGDFLPPPKA